MQGEGYIPKQNVIDELKQRGVKKVYLITTYALFTKGVDKFDEYYK